MKSNSDWQRFATPLGFVRLILLVEWDPIGLFGHPQTMDEYDRYALEVYDLLLDGAASDQIAEYLRDVTRRSMEIRSPSNTHVVAEKLVRVFEISTGERE